MEFKIIEINNEWIVQLEELAQNALEDGYRIVRKTIDEWIKGVNRFDDSREVLYGVMAEDDIVAIGGINIDPYLMDEDIGRLRHVYVHTNYRKQGIARLLLEQILDKYENHYKVLRLNTNSEKAMQLYEEYGFRKVVEFRATHIKIVKK